MTATTTAGAAFVRLQDQQLRAEAGVIGHLNGYGVTRMSTLQTGPVADLGPATLTVYEMYPGLVRSVDEVGEVTDHVRRGLGYDELAEEEVEVDVYVTFEDVVAGLRAQGWEVVATETFAGRAAAATAAAKARKQAVKNARVARERAGYREWGLTYDGEEVSWHGHDEGGEAAAREALTGWGSGAYLVFRDVGPVQTADTRLL